MNKHINETQLMIFKNFKIKRIYDEKKVVDYRIII